MLLRKELTFVILFLFIGMGVISSTGRIVLNNYSQPGIVYIDDDFNESTPGWGYDHFDRIQYGIDAVDENGTVYVYNGTYYESLFIYKTIWLLGEDKESTVIDSNGSGDVVHIHADKVLIYNFTIQNSGVNSQSGIDVYSNNNIISGNTISNHSIGIWLLHQSSCKIISNTFHSNSRCSISLWNSENNTIYFNNISGNGDGIYLDYSKSNIIGDNDISSNNNVGIHLTESINNYISSNNISNNGEDGIHLSYSSYNTIYGNNISNNGEGGIYLSWCSYNSINGNKIKNNFNGIRLFASSNTTISGNDISNNQGDGIYLLFDGTIDNNITDNNIISNYNNGISIDFSYYNIISGNNISNNGVVGLFLFISNNNTIAGNIITSNYEEGIYLNGISNNITRNIISENEDGIELEDSFKNIIKGNNISSNYDYGIEAIVHSTTFKKSNCNMILKNNFINNQQHAYFIGNNNIWRQNYWDRARIFPKFILGKLLIFHHLIPWIPWVNFDWRPALKPYDIWV